MLRHKREQQRGAPVCAIVATGLRIRGAGGTETPCVVVTKAQPMSWTISVSTGAQARENNAWSGGKSGSTGGGLTTRDKRGVSAGEVGGTSGGGT